MTCAFCHVAEGHVHRTFEIKMGALVLSVLAYCYLHCDFRQNLHSIHIAGSILYQSLAHCVCIIRTSYHFVLFDRHVKDLFASDTTLEELKKFPLQRHELSFTSFLMVLEREPMTNTP